MTGPELEALLALQDLDTHIDQERHLRAHLPERAELFELRRLAGDKRAARAEIAGPLGEVVSRQEVAERELKAVEARIAQVNARLFGGSVSASRELQAMAADVEGLRRRASEMEDRVLELMEERAPLEAAVAEIDRELAELTEREGEVAESQARAEAELDAILARLAPERQALSGAVAQGLLGTYEALRARLGGVAVARLVGGRCDGCHLSLPAMELDRVRHKPPGSLEYCEQCGRILVIPAV